MDLSRYEQETIISYNEEEQTASVYTFNGPLRRKLEKLAEERPEECRLQEARSCGSVEFIVPKKWIKVKPPTVLSLTDEQREELRQRGKRNAEFLKAKQTEG